MVPYVLEEFCYGRIGCFHLVEDVVHVLLGFLEVLVGVVVDSCGKHGAMDGDVCGTA